MTQRITRQIEFDAGHRIPNHSSKCRNLHGHRYVVQATVEGEINQETRDSSEGMVEDFSVLKDAMMTYIHNVLDHRMILHREDIFIHGYVLGIKEMDYVFRSLGIVTHDYIPTAENLARWCFEQLASNLPTLNLVNVRVYETPNCWADYSPKQS